MDLSKKNSTYKEGAASEYFLLLMGISLLWFFYYTPAHKNASAVVSIICQQILIFGIFHIVDFSIKYKRIRFILSGTALLYTTLILINALILSVTQISLFESFSIFALGGDFFLSSKEAGFSVVAYCGLMAGSLAIIYTGGIVHGQVLKRSKPGTLTGAKIYAFLIILLMVFISEQVYSRDNFNYFARREYPLYCQLFSSGKHTVEIKIPSSPGNNETENYISSIKKLENPQDILIILLESFRWDMIDENISPNIYSLGKTGLTFKQSYSDAIYTSLAWNSFLMDMPAATLERDIEEFNITSPGSLPLRILKKAGYDVKLSFSANFNWNNFYNRVNGRDKLIDKYFCAYDSFQKVERNVLDKKACEKIVHWIQNQKAASPSIMFLQLDSTHYPYYAESNAKVFHPFAEEINPLELSSDEGIKLLFNRYKNAVRNVDNRIGEVIAALKKNGKYDSTVIAIVGDHGEGFSRGMIGHSVLHDDIKRLPLIVKLPGREAGEIKTPVTQRDIFPSIFDHLAIRGLNSSLLKGKSFLNNDDEKRPVLTFHGSLKMADLTLHDKIISFRTKVFNDRILFTPYSISCRDGKSIVNGSYSFNDTGWEGLLKSIIGQANKGNIISKKIQLKKM